MSAGTRAGTQLARIRRMTFIMLSLGCSCFLSGIAGAQTKNPSPKNDPFIAAHRRALGQNPKAVSFNISLEKGKKRFLPGEVIYVKYRFTSRVSNEYGVIEWRPSREGRFYPDRLLLDHRTGVVDPFAEYYDSRASRGEPSDPEPLEETPYEIDVDLNPYLRFDQPGTFRLYITAPRIGKPGEENPSKPVEVTSNIIEFEIAPFDEKWAEEELESVRRLMASPESHRNPLVCYRLGYLGTEGAAAEMIRLLGLRQLEGDRYCFDGLIGSAHRKFIVKELERGLEAPDQGISRWHLSALSDLTEPAEIKDSLRAAAPEGKSNDAFLKAWNLRNEARGRRLKGYLKRLALAIPNKQGEARVSSIMTFLQSIQNPHPPADNDSVGEMADRLAADLAQVFKDLPRPLRIFLLGSHWNQIKSPALLPALFELLEDSSNTTDYYDPKEHRGLLFKKIFELSPGEKRRLLIEEMARPIPRIRAGALGSLPEKTLPELDQVFCENLEKSTEHDAQATHSWLIARYASPAVAARVDRFYGDRGGRLPCLIQSSLLGYFLRVNHPGVMDRIKQALDARSEDQTRCYANTMTDVAGWQMTPELERLAVERLDDPDPDVVRNAAVMLSEYGSADVETPLWRRLEKWRREWKGKRTAKILDSDDSLYQEKTLGQSLRMAINRASAWLLDREKLDRLRETCLSEHDLQQFNHEAREWDGPVRISFFTPGYGWGTAHIAQYSCHSRASLERKIRQFPSGTVFVWDVTRSLTDEEEQRFTEIKEALEASGMTLDRSK